MTKKELERMRNKATHEQKELRAKIDSHANVVASCASHIGATQMSVLLAKVGDDVENPSSVLTQSVAESIATMSVEMATLILMMSVARVEKLYSDMSELANNPPKEASDGEDTPTDSGV